MRTVRPTGEFNQPDLLLLGTGCNLRPAIPYSCGGGEGARRRGPEALPVPEGKVQADLRYFEVEGHSSQESTTKQRQGLPGMLVGGGDIEVKQRGLQEGRHRTESQRVLASTQLLLAMGKPAHSRHLSFH